MSKNGALLALLCIMGLLTAAVEDASTQDATPNFLKQTLTVERHMLKGFCNNELVSLRAHCFGLIEGVVGLQDAPLEIGGRRFCVPDETGLQKVKEDILRWIDNHPNGDKFEPASYAIFRALVAEYPYPCK